MPDSKITALASTGTGTDPANDPLVIVDVSDTSMAASGTTKKVTLNNLLACSPTATLASATISGDLTVDTSTLKVDSANNRVGIVQATPLYPLHLVGEFGLDETSAGNGSRLRLIGDASKYNFRLGKQITVSNAFEITPSTAAGGTTFSNPVYTVTYDGIHTFLDGAGGTRMTLNSTGLGVGVAPAAGDGSGVFKAAGTGSFTANTRVGLDVRELVSGNQAGILLGAMTTENTAVIGARTGSGNIAFQTYNGAAWGERMRIDYIGNVGVGVTPSAWGSGNKFIDINSSAAFGAFGASDAMMIGNAYWNGSSWIRKTANNAWRFVIESVSSTPTMTWQLAANGSAGSSITWTQAMTLSAAGSLVLGAAAVATTATDGFLYIPGCAGTPTGTPTAQTGRVPLVVDTTNNKLYFYSGGSWVAAN